MRVKKLHFEDYKRFHDLTIDLGEKPARIVALVGPNGCGKSSVFDGMLYINNAYGVIGGSRNTANDYRYHSLNQESNYNYQKNLIEFDEGKEMESNMKKIDNDGLLLCEMQAKAFELSCEAQSTSSEIFNSPNELYWIGYIYRYYAYTYDKTSRQVYKTVKPKELRGLFLPYHTMDPAQAIDRILEAKGLANDNVDEEKRQFEIFKRIRKRTHC